MMSFTVAVLMAPVFLFLVLVAPIWIVAHYLTRWRAAKTLSAEDERALDEVWRGLDRLETRLVTIERILDAENPSWRKHP